MKPHKYVCPECGYEICEREFLYEREWKTLCPSCEMAEYWDFKEVELTEKELSEYQWWTA